MTEEQSRYSRFVNPDAPPGQPEASEPYEPEANPWLFVMTGVGILSFIIGLAMYDNAYVGIDDVAMQALWAFVFMGFGVMLLVAAMASAAICWQLRRSGSSS